MKRMWICNCCGYRDTALRIACPHCGKLTDRHDGEKRRKNMTKKISNITVYLTSGRVRNGIDYMIDDSVLTLDCHNGTTGIYPLNVVEEICVRYEEGE